jgi:cysteine desulfurase
LGKPIYLDYHATTPLDPTVLDVMLPYFRDRFGNAASGSHSFGWDAEAAVALARGRVAKLAGTTPENVVFTSGATESDNLAIKGVMEAARSAAGSAGHIVTVATEHKAVLDSVRALEDSGCTATVLRPERGGLLDPERLRAAILPETVLVSVMYANNEIGVVQPMAEIGAICREKNVLLHSDAVQAFGKLPIDMEALGIGLMSVTAHKMYGPKGTGALCIRRGARVRLRPQIHGGGHEHGLRSGTLNVPGIVGFGEACAIASRDMAAEWERVGALRDRLETALTSGIAGAHVNGERHARLAGNLNVSFEGVNGDALLLALPDLAVSAASACGSHGTPGSHVLRALGLPEELVQSAVRFGLGRFTTAEEIERAAARVVEAVGRLRKDSPSAAPSQLRDAPIVM